MADKLESVKIQKKLKKLTPEKKKELLDKAFEMKGTFKSQKDKKPVVQYIKPLVEMVKPFIKRVIVSSSPLLYKNTYLKEKEIINTLNLESSVFCYRMILLSENATKKIVTKPLSLPSPTDKEGGKRRKKTRKKKRRKKRKSNKKRKNKKKRTKRKNKKRRTKKRRRR